VLFNSVQCYCLGFDYSDPLDNTVIRTLHEEINKLLPLISLRGVIDVFNWLVEYSKQRVKTFDKFKYNGKKYKDLTVKAG
jgi:hypothetical protein